MATKSTPDPVQTARTRLAEAQRAETEAHAALENHKDRILAGDETVSSEDYAAAAHEHEHAQLRKQAAFLALQAAENDARLADLEQVKANILAEAGDPAEVLHAMRQLEQAAAVILRYDQARNRRIHQWIGQLRARRVPRIQQLGKKAHEYTEPTAEHAGLGWTSRDSAWAFDAVYVGDRTIRALAEGYVISAALARAAKSIGMHPHALRINPRDVHEGLLNDPAAWLNERY